MLLKDELKKAFENVASKSIGEYPTTAEMLHAFNRLYECYVTFSVTPDTAAIVVKDSGSNVVPIDTDGTYHLKAGSYTYTITAEGYTSITDKALSISSANVTTGARTVTETLAESE